MTPYSSGKWCGVRASGPCSTTERDHVEYSYQTPCTYHLCGARNTSPRSITSIADSDCLSEKIRRRHQTNASQAEDAKSPSVHRHERSRPSLKRHRIHRCIRNPGDRRDRRRRCRTTTCRRTSEDRQNHPTKILSVRCGRVSSGGQGHGLRPDLQARRTERYNGAGDCCGWPPRDEGSEARDRETGRIGCESRSAYREYGLRRGSNAGPGRKCDCAAAHS